MVIKQFVAMKAFIFFGGKVLVLRESDKYTDGTNAGKYDVVGGRVKPGEQFEESLRREIKEETGLSVSIGDPFYVGEWRPMVAGEHWQVIGTFFECVAETDEVKLGKDHDGYKWISPGEFDKLPVIESVKQAFDKYLEMAESGGCCGGGCCEGKC